MQVYVKNSGSIFDCKSKVLSLTKHVTFRNNNSGISAFTSGLSWITEGWREGQSVDEVISSYYWVYLQQYAINLFGKKNILCQTRIWVNLKKCKRQVAKQSRTCFGLRKWSVKEYVNTSVTYLRFFQNTVYHRWFLFLCYQLVPNSNFQYTSCLAQCLKWDALLSEIKPRVQLIWEVLKRYRENCSKISFVMFSVS